ncbi:MocR-like pyridoxine biosynthesis transcription factor PdxR [Actinoallomurus rhizosphaericola]|uniref:MocR-like pyridoxine biosynthesis transcription factor PdxR n=1 Tax=Actinoallomurus rhizosphaericola TaxID=2952536 RepID=UPI002090C26D|nr:PLP-dependent aminotransferase family protein [Actinoallomurus rhizosphaericola]MCO5992710.1 PLP-dependent aminotransferase family protein [Actinoallomurus rhizosphaericola]
MDLHLTLDRSAGRLAAQVADGLRDLVRRGALGPGHRLPSTRDLAGDLKVSRGVIVTAYEQLVAEGFLVSRQGDGTRVARTVTPPRPAAPAGAAHRRAVRLAAATEAEPIDPPGIAYDLRPGKPDLTSFPRERWAATMREVLRDLPYAELNYPDPAGTRRLRTELAAYLARVRAAVATPETVVVTAGVAHVLATVPRILREEGHRLLAVEDPLAHQQLPMLRATGVRTVGIPVDEEGIDVTALARTRARALLVTPAHQFPTGVVLSPRRRAALVEWARAVDAVIIEDDYDGEFRYDRDPVGCLQGLAPERVVLAGSVSKALSPALRLGWVAAPPWLAVRMRAARALYDLGSSALDQQVLARLIATGGYDRHLRGMRRRYRDRRDAFATALTRRLPQVRVHGVSAGLHAYVELPAGTDETDVVARAAALGVAVQGVAPMRVRHPGPPAIVIGYARLPEHRLAEAVDLLAQALSPDRPK